MLTSLVVLLLETQSCCLNFDPLWSHQSLAYLLQPYSVSYSDLDEIYEKNILHATISAMHRAIDNLKTVPDNIIVDGNYFKPYSILNKTKTKLEMEGFQLHTKFTNFIFKIFNILATHILSGR